jgi:hypothetical protein
MSDLTPFEPRIEDYARAFPCVLDRVSCTPEVKPG